MSDCWPQPHDVVVLATGGTIAMSRQTGESTVAPTLTADELVSKVPGLGTSVRIEARTLVNRPGASLTVADVLTVLQAARDAIDDGALGVVVTQGTDTMEETSFLIDLLWDRSEPLVVTGAMRNPTEPGADGPRNLKSAIAVAVSPMCRDLGCLVVLNDQVHAARYVRKEHSSSPSAFVSPNAGPIGSIKEGQPIVHVAPFRRARAMSSPTGPLASVALIEATFDDGGRLLEGVTERYDGIVVAAFGGGHLSERAAGAAVAASVVKPVVLASRCAAGGPLTRTYGFVGSETYLLDHGLISAGDLDARKARLLLLLLLSNGADRDAIVSSFAELTC